MKKIIEVVLFDTKRDRWYLPTNLVSYMEFIRSKAAEIPVEFLKSASISQNACEKYGDSFVKTVIAYTRPETDEEENAREERERTAEKNRRQEEINEMHRLREKYGE